jgi:hypothetical protein
MSLLRQSKLALPPDLAVLNQALDDEPAELRWVGRAGGGAHSTAAAAVAQSVQCLLHAMARFM